MRKTAEIVIIGGGAIGCAVAYSLAKRGFKDIILLEKKYLSSGSTGRCAAGIRQQWGTRLNCLLTKESARILRTLNEELETADIGYQEKGYLLLAYAEQHVKMLEDNLKLQQNLGIPSIKVSVQEAKEIVPCLNTKGMMAGFFCQEDGYINPFKLTFAYAKAAQRLGVKIKTYIEVTGLKKFKDKIMTVVTEKGEIDTAIVINATGPYAASISKMVGLKHPVFPKRQHALITEPMEPIIGPGIMSFKHNSFCQQVPEGGVIMVTNNPDEQIGFYDHEDWEFLDDMSGKICDQLPVCKNLRILRQWAGLYDISPDEQPILGGVQEFSNYFLALGCGRGLMLAPVIGKLIAESLLEKETDFPIEILNVERFEKGELLVEPAVIVSDPTKV